MAIRNEEPHVNKCFPRARGDVPGLEQLDHARNLFSPRTRGCSLWCRSPFCSELVFPAHAGMFLLQYISTRKPKSFPRARGDVPFFSTRQMSIPRFSPRTRGCSAMVRNRNKTHVVFPAHAGMFLPYSSLAVLFVSFPRARGDVPRGSP